MSLARSTKDRGIWICSQRDVWTRAIAAVLEVCTGREIRVLRSLDPDRISKEIRNKPVLARPWPEDVLILDLSLYADEAAARMLAVYRQLRNEIFWIGPCMVVGRHTQCAKLSATPIVPGGFNFGEYPSIHGFWAPALTLVDLLRNLRLVWEGTLELTEWTSIVEVSPILRRLSEGLAVLQAAVENGESHDVLLREAGQLSEVAGDLCCELEFIHGPRSEACCRLQAFVKLESPSATQIRQLVKDARLVLRQWRTSDGQG